jgi:hypothetical protein
LRAEATILDQDARHAAGVGAEIGGDSGGAPIDLDDAQAARIEQSLDQPVLAAGGHKRDLACRDQRSRRGQRDAGQNVGEIGAAKRRRGVDPGIECVGGELGMLFPAQPHLAQVEPQELGLPGLVEAAAAAKLGDPLAVLGGLLLARQESVMDEAPRRLDAEERARMHLADELRAQRMIDEAAPQSRFGNACPRLGFFLRHRCQAISLRREWASEHIRG